MYAVDLWPFLFLISGAFLNAHISLDGWSKISSLDFLLLKEVFVAKSASLIYDYMCFDINSFLQTNFFILNFLFLTDYQNFVLFLVHHSPELLFGLIDFITVYWLGSTFSFSPSSLFDTFMDLPNPLSSSFVEYFMFFTLYFFFVIYFLGNFRIKKWNKLLEVYLVRIYCYSFTISREARLQFEAMLLLLFLFIFYFSFMVATFDDDQEEAIEWFHSFSFFVFLTLFIYLVFRYSFHYFSFLQASEPKGRFVGMVAQFVHDSINTFALALRFIVLIIRLNMYDFLDDVLDSYYIFLCDFDDDEFFVETFFSMFSLFFFDSDNQDDRSFFFEDEIDFTVDLFSIYFLIWSKFVLFFFFAIDEVARVFLAFYLVYLMIFEMQAVNRSFPEDNFFLKKRKQ